MKKEKIKSTIKWLNSDIIEYPFSPSEHKQGVVIQLENVGKASLNSIMKCCEESTFFEINKTELRFFNPKIK